MASSTRDHFESKRFVRDWGVINLCVQEASNWLAANTHPDPYTSPTNPGGSKFQRTVPPDLSIIEQPEFDLLDGQDDDDKNTKWFS